MNAELTTAVEAVFRKFAIVAAAVADRPVVKKPADGLATPPAFIESIVQLARAADSGFVLPCTVGLSVAGDLVAWLAAAPQILRVCEPDYLPEPSRAWLEHRAGKFWQLAALIQDCYEHTAGPERQIDGHLLRQVMYWAQSPVCDFGAGAGRFGCALSEVGLTVRCVENNAVKRAFLRFRALRRGLPDPSLTGTKGRSFRTMLAINVLDHVAWPLEMLRALTNRLPTGGRLLCRAAFPDDGWHQGSIANRKLVHAFLGHHFQPIGRTHGSPHLLTLEKRDAPDPIRFWDRPKARLCLDPAVSIRTDPQCPRTFLAASRIHFSDAMRLSDSGRGLLEFFRNGATMADARQWATHCDVDHDTFSNAIERFVDAGFLASLED